LFSIAASQCHGIQSHFPRRIEYRRRALALPEANVERPVVLPELAVVLDNWLCFGSLHYRE